MASSIVSMKDEEPSSSSTPLPPSRRAQRSTSSPSRSTSSTLRESNGLWVWKPMKVMTTDSSSSESSSSLPVTSLDETDTKEEEEVELKLIDKHGKRHPILYSAALQSGLLKTTVQDLDGSKLQSLDPNIPIPFGETATVSAVTEFMTYHAKFPCRQVRQPLRTMDLSMLVSVWDYQFMERWLGEVRPKVVSLQQQEKILELQQLANYMHIPTLFQLVGVVIATWIGDRTPDQIRTALQITNTFLPHQEAQIQESMRWVTESLRSS